MKIKKRYLKIRYNINRNKPIVILISFFFIIAIIPTGRSDDDFSLILEKSNDINIAENLSNISSINESSTINYTSLVIPDLSNFTLLQEISNSSGLLDGGENFTVFVDGDNLSVFDGGVNGSGMLDAEENVSVFVDGDNLSIFENDMNNSTKKSNESNISIPLYTNDSENNVTNEEFFDEIVVFNDIPYLGDFPTRGQGTIWTTRNDCGDFNQDVNHYNIGDHVFINGENFNPLTSYEWSITGRPGGASCDPGEVVASGYILTNEIGTFCFDAYTIQPDDCGTYQVKVGNKGDNYQVNVSNVAPVLGEIPDQTIDEGFSFATISLDDYVSDVDNLDSEMTWSYAGNVELSVSIDGSRVATISIPELDWFGSEMITFRATDPGGLYDEDAATFTVTAVNDAPVVGDIPDQTITEGQSFASINLNNFVSDTETTDANITWSYSGNIDLTVSIIDQIATISIPSSHWTGTETINFTAMDESLLTNSDTATFTVTAILRGSSNEPPIANTNGPYHGFINAEIEFDASGSIDIDGMITNYTWNFGDGTKGYGPKLTHLYNTSGQYIVTLKIIDDDGAISTTTTLAVINQANRPPSNPIVVGVEYGTKNIHYNYTAVSIDLDNDALQYIFDWGDGNTNITGFYANGTTVQRTYSWTAAGKYIVNVTAYDNNTYSGVTSYIVLIDALLIGDIGYITDDDADGTYDTFHNASLETSLGQETDNYLIDSNGDSKWEYVYNLETGLKTYFDYVYQKYYDLYQKTSKTPGFEMITLLAIIALLVILLRWRK